MAVIYAVNLLTEYIYIALSNLVYMFNLNKNLFFVGYKF